MVAEMKAELIGRAARRDLQLTVPTRPVLRRGVRLRRAGNSVVLDGADRMQAFSGAFATEGLVPLAAACDGRRDHAELARELGMDEAAVYKCLALLWTAGAVEEAVSGDEPAVAPELACFLSRLGNSTGANASWADAAGRLARRPVLLAGAPALVAAARTVLGDVCRIVDEPQAGALTVFFETASSGPAQVGDGPLLRVRADARTVVIGPYVDAAITPCLDCGRQGEPEPAGEPPAHGHDLVVGLAAHHVMALLARATITHLPTDSSVIDLATLSTAYLPATSRPGCPSCSAARGPVAPAPVSAVYEAAVALPPRQFLDPKGHQAHYYTANIRLQSQFKDWPSRLHTPLPEPDLSALTEANRADGPRALSVRELSLVLKIAFGVKDAETTPEHVKRWTAASGNIGCTTAYVLVRDANLLPPGVYAYAESSHTLAAVSATVPAGDGPCELVVTGDLKKVMTKYGTFGFRLALLDSGCALTSVRAVAGQLGLTFAPRADWDDDALARVLDASLTEEPVVAVASIGGVA